MNVDDTHLNGPVSLLMTFSDPPDVRYRQWTFCSFNSDPSYIRVNPWWDFDSDCRSVSSAL